MKTNLIFLICNTLFLIIPVSFAYARERLPQEAISIEQKELSNPTVGTGQVSCYNNSREVPWPKPGQPFYGQDAQYESNVPSYQDNGDGTVTDLNTGLLWSKAVDKNKVSLVEAKRIAQRMTLGGYSDWRTPNIKELYSLIDFRGYTGFSRKRASSGVPDNAIPFINTDYFDFEYGNVNAGERYIDAQWLSNTKYVSTTMNGDKTLFGVNFADGRIKGYGYRMPRGNREKKFYVRYVRGNPYGKNEFVYNGDGTVTDSVTGFMWMQKDSGSGMDWKSALTYAEGLVYAGHNDWRLPNAKELQYIVDYSRSPNTTDSPAISPVFNTSSIVNEAGQKDYPYFWSSTTHLEGAIPGSNAAYIAFGRAIGKMRGKVMDVHGAGSQRSDPKAGNSPTWHGPQGDARRTNNYVRCVRGGPIKISTHAPSHDKSKYPDNIKKHEINSQKEQRNSIGISRSPSGRRGFVKRLDRDNDGKISRSEFDGPKGRFGFLDKNGDGYLSEDEAPKGPPPSGGRRPRF